MISSTAAAAGETANGRPAFWSQAETSQSAAQCGGQCAADHETEVSRARGGHQPGFGSGHQRVDDDVGCLTTLRQRTAERIAHACGVDTGGHRTLVEAAEELLCMPRRGGQAGGAIPHE